MQVELSYPEVYTAFEEATQSTTPYLRTKDGYLRTKDQEKLRTKE